MFVCLRFKWEEEETLCHCEKDPEEQFSWQTLRQDGGCTIIHRDALYLTSESRSSWDWIEDGTVCIFYIFSLSYNCPCIASSMTIYESRTQWKSCLYNRSIIISECTVSAGSQTASCQPVQLVCQLDDTLHSHFCPTHITAK